MLKQGFDGCKLCWNVKCTRNLGKKIFVGSHTLISTNNRLYNRSEFYPRVLRKYTVFSSFFLFWLLFFSLPNSSYSLMMFVPSIVYSVTETYWGSNVKKKITTSATKFRWLYPNWTFHILKYMRTMFWNLCMHALYHVQIHMYHVKGKVRKLTKEMQAASSKILTNRSSNCSTTNSQIVFPVRENTANHIHDSSVWGHGKWMSNINSQAFAYKID